MNAANVIEYINSSLPIIKDHHCPYSDLYKILKQTAREAIEELFNDKSKKAKSFYPYGKIIFPYFKMGNIDSLNLFDLDELILFSFYWVNRKRYRNVLDIGANIGLHSIIMYKCGYRVKAYEPDPIHFRVLRRNLELNHCIKVKAFETAVSSKSGEMEFIRVLGNTTGSHLAGSKVNPYGRLKRFRVKVESIKPLFQWADFIKMDVEGHEKAIILATSRNDWLKTDAIVEVGSKPNATAIFNHFKFLGIYLFSQKINWQQVRKIEDMPMSHLDGSLFISSKKKGPWL